MRRTIRCLDTALSGASRKGDGKLPVIRLSEIGEKKMSNSLILPVTLQANDIRKSKSKHRDVGVVEVVGPSGRSYGVASYNPSAYTSCRILHRNAQVHIDHEFFYDAFNKALQSRIAAFGGMPELRKRPFRLINGDGDHLSGLYVDVFSPTTAIVSSSTAFMDRQMQHIVQALRTLLPGLTKVYLRHDDHSSRAFEFLPSVRPHLLWSSEPPCTGSVDITGLHHQMTSDELLLLQLPVWLRLARPDATRRKVLAVSTVAGRLATSMVKTLEGGEEEFEEKVMVIAVERSRRLCREMEESIKSSCIRSRVVVEHNVPRLWLEERRDMAGEFDMVIISPRVSEVEALKKLLASAAQQLVPGGVLVLSGVDEIRYVRFQKILLQALAPRLATLIYESTGASDFPLPLVPSARDGCADRVLAVRVGSDVYDA